MSKFHLTIYPIITAILREAFKPRVVKTLTDLDSRKNAIRFRGVTLWGRCRGTTDGILYPSIKELERNGDIPRLFDEYFLISKGLEDYFRVFELSFKGEAVCFEYLPKVFLDLASKYFSFSAESKNDNYFWVSSLDAKNDLIQKEQVFYRLLGHLLLN